MDILELIQGRQSSRAMFDPDKKIPEEELKSGSAQRAEETARPQ
jgi:hypothetical protein